MVDVNTAGIINTALGLLPSVLNLIKANHAAANPGEPPLTDEQVKAALRDAVAQSLAKDDEIEADIKRRRDAENPPPPGGEPTT